MPLSKAELTSTESGRELSFRSGAIPCVSLSLAVAAEEPSDESELLVVNTRSGLVAVTVSELVDRRRVAVKNLGPILEGAGHITGAALLGGGQVLVVLDPNFLGVLARQRPRPVDDRPRVLVVDDSVTSRMLNKKLLTASGFQVATANDGRAALDMVHAQHCDLVLTDIQMPQMDGYELTRRIKQDPQHSNLPVILLTTLDSQEDKKRGVEAGADAYLVKRDLSQAELVDIIEQLI